MKSDMWLIILGSGICAGVAMGSALILTVTLEGIRNEREAIQYILEEHERTCPHSRGEGSETPAGKTKVRKTIRT